MTAPTIHTELSHLELPVRLGWQDFIAAQAKDDAPYLKSPCAYITTRTRDWLTFVTAQAQLLVDAGAPAQAVLTFIAFVSEGHLEAAKVHHRRVLESVTKEGSK